MPKLPIPIPKKLPLPTNIPVEQSLTILVDAWRDYKKTHEVEVTKREFISAQKEVSLERIRSQKAIIEQYLSNTFRERQQVISGMFHTLDKGIETGNDQLINAAMNTIIATVQTSPLQGVKEIFQQMDDENVDCIEI